MGWREVVSEFFFGVFWFLVKGIDFSGRNGVFIWYR